jgi:hypothetical protein
MLAATSPNTFVGGQASNFQFGSIDPMVTIDPSFADANQFETLFVLVSATFPRRLAPAV